MCLQVVVVVVVVCRGQGDEEMVVGIHLLQQGWLMHVHMLVLVVLVLTHINGETRVGCGGSMVAGNRNCGRVIG